MSSLIGSRWLSSALVGIVVIVSLCFIGTEFAAKLFVSMIFPVACIWYAEELGGRIGISGSLSGPRVTESTPGLAVAIGGWLLLICIVTVAFCFWQSFDCGYLIIQVFRRNFDRDKKT